LARAHELRSRLQDDLCGQAEVIAKRAILSNVGTLLGRTPILYGGPTDAHRSALTVGAMLGRGMMTFGTVRRAKMLMQEEDLEVGDFWHLTAPNGLLLHNAYLGRGVVQSASLVRQTPGLEAVASPYGIGATLEPKEQRWEEVRAKEFPQCPSRLHATFLFDDLATAEKARDSWFGSEERIVLPCRVLKGSALYAADANWLDALETNWEAYARRYWSSVKTENPMIEIIVTGRVFFSGWRHPPFGLWRP
jgi:hypothetical protein